MKIIKKRINNVENYISTVRNGEEFHISFRDFPLVLVYNEYLFSN